MTYISSFSSIVPLYLVQRLPDYILKAAEMTEIPIGMLCDKPAGRWSRDILCDRKNAINQAVGGFWKKIYDFENFLSMAEERSELHNKRYPEIFSEAREDRLQLRSALSLWDDRGKISDASCPAAGGDISRKNIANLRIHRFIYNTMRNIISQSAVNFGQNSIIPRGPVPTVNRHPRLLFHPIIFFPTAY